jgi:hypothetical protein
MKTGTIDKNIGMIDAGQKKCGKKMFDSADGLAMAAKCGATAGISNVLGQCGDLDPFTDKGTSAGSGSRVHFHPSPRPRVEANTLHHDRCLKRLRFHHTTRDYNIKFRVKNKTGEKAKRMRLLLHRTDNG